MADILELENRMFLAAKRLDDAGREKDCQDLIDRWYTWSSVQWFGRQTGDVWED